MREINLFKDRCHMINSELLAFLADAIFGSANDGAAAKDHIAIHL